MQTVLEDFEKMNVKLSDSKYLAFILDGINYGIPIGFVTEIIKVVNITPIPKSPQFLVGVINLRGKLIPTMDLRLKLDMPKKEYNEKTCIIIVNPHNNKYELIGLIVDMVSEVFAIPESDMDNSLKNNFFGNENFLEGVGKIEDKAVIILNIPSIVTTAEIINHVDNSNNEYAIV